MSTTYKLKSPAMLRKGFRAYMGVHATAFEMLVAQKEKAQDFSKAKTQDYVARGTKLETSISAIFAKTPKFVRRATPCGVATSVGILPKRNEIVELEATIDGLKRELAGLETKPSKKPKSKSARHIPYYEAVLKYDAKASEDVVRKIVNHCGIALSNNDGKFVACSDESERVTVRDSWLKKKLGMTATDATLDNKVLAVCKTMKADRLKSRVTFYYLLAKAEGKLETL